MLNLTNSEELLGSPLIRSKAGNLTDEVADKLVVLGQLALGIKEVSSDFLFLNLVFVAALLLERLECDYLLSV